ncbi:mRNA-capping enzyme isoform X2 [Dermatophagoides farinae]|uniref:mRNA-capping enzyme isoform X2 n=1 Tax=Dermatophagoides farinae TaxID=6954 RepID=UPI001F10CE2C|nr:mRNA-capping enzyme-like isoform X2 [Dermatophagoides farinae]
MAEPKGWAKCPEIGDLVADNFVPFKVPFGPSFTPEYLNVGLWIDLTNTRRYYRSDLVKNQNIRYEKIFVTGHGECPSNDQIKRFIQICSNFLRMHPDQEIAVHCTHGFNRTGFMICAYMVRELGWSISQAIDHFSERRHPGIYRQEYIDELLRMFSNGDDDPRTITAPAKPDWSRDNNRRSYNHYHRRTSSSDPDNLIGRMNNLRISQQPVIDNNYNYYYDDDY